MYNDIIQRANELVKAKIHPTNVMAGYRLAMRESVKYIKSNLLINTGTLERRYVNIYKLNLNKYS